jgi:hypothetical protein
VSEAGRGTNGSAAREFEAAAFVFGRETIFAWLQLFGQVG